MNKCDIRTQNLLMARIEQNYEDYEKSVTQLDSETVFELAPTIAAVKDVYFYMTTHDWADAEQGEYLLQFENPLKLLADLWEEKSEDRNEDFGDMIDMLYGDAYEDYTESYVTVSLADELRDKYGDDMPIDGAIICEIVELGKKLYKC